MLLLSATNNHSCALACVVSIAHDCGVVITQDRILNDPAYVALFPDWQTAPGKLNECGNPDVSDAREICKQLGVATARRLLYHRDEIIAAMLSTATAGAVLCTANYYDANGVVTAGNHHAMRIVGVSNLHFTVMNPGRNGAVALEVHEWTDLALYGAYVVLLENPRTNP